MKMNHKGTKSTKEKREKVNGEGADPGGQETSRRQSATKAVVVFDLCALYAFVVQKSEPETGALPRG
jgi:hypothetical protein